MHALAVRTARYVRAFRPTPKKQYTNNSLLCPNREYLLNVLLTAFDVDTTIIDKMIHPRKNKGAKELPFRRRPDVAFLRFRQKRGTRFFVFGKMRGEPRGGNSGAVLGLGECGWGAYV